jgi:putative FmdB family regulatory protein
MPIYEYRCRHCGEVFARLRSVNAASEPQRCPKCDGDNTERLLSTFAAGTSSPGSGTSIPSSSCGGGGG